MIQTNEIYTCQWYKCRGQTCKNVSDINEEHKLQYNAISNVKILKTYDLKKCVDASPAVFHYSDGKTYATVGSHSGFIFTNSSETCTTIVLRIIAIIKISTFLSDTLSFALYIMCTRVEHSITRV